MSNIGRHMPGAFLVGVVNPKGEVVISWEDFDTIEQARGYAAIQVSIPGKFVGAVIYTRAEICWPEALAKANFVSAAPALPDPTNTQR